MITKFLVAGLLISNTVFAGTKTPFNPYNTVESVEADATDFKITGAKITKMPFSSVFEKSQSCYEGPGTCDSTHFEDYKPVIRIAVSYRTRAQVFSDYPQGNDVTVNFHIPVTNQNIADLAALRKSQRIVALQNLVSVEKVSAPSRIAIITKMCDRTLVGESEWRQLDSTCRDEFEFSSNKVYSLKLTVK
jgi:hypothetical protein